MGDSVTVFPPYLKPVCFWLGAVIGGLGVFPVFLHPLTLVGDSAEAGALLENLGFVLLSEFIPYFAFLQALDPFSSLEQWSPIF